MSEEGELKLSADDMKVMDNYLEVKHNRVVYGLKIKPIWIQFINIDNVTSCHIRGEKMICQFRIKEDGMDVPFNVTLDKQKSVTIVPRRQIRKFDMDSFSDDELFKFCSKYGIADIRTREQYDCYTKLPKIKNITEEQIKTKMRNKMKLDEYESLYLYQWKRGCYFVSDEDERNHQHKLIDNGVHRVQEKICGSDGREYESKSPTQWILHGDDETKDILNMYKLQFYHNFVTIVLSYVSYLGFDPLIETSPMGRTFHMINLRSIIPTMRLRYFQTSSNIDSFYLYQITELKDGIDVDDVVTILPPIDVFTRGDDPIKGVCYDRESTVKSFVLHRTLFKK